MDAGRAIATGSPDALKRQVGGDQLEIEIGPSGDLEVAGAVLGRIAGGPVDVDADTRLVSAPVPVTALTHALQALAEAGVPVVDLTVRRPTLDDVFLRLTGHKTSTEAGEEVPA
jgi:ABC-2 type transport system ATP-binding protein